MTKTWQLRKIPIDSILKVGLVKIFVLNASLSHKIIFNSHRLGCVLPEDSDSEFDYGYVPEDDGTKSVG